MREFYTYRIRNFKGWMIEPGINDWIDERLEIDWIQDRPQRCADRQP